jgi:hypothetical protein
VGHIYAYARASADAQDLEPQTDELCKDGFDVMVVEKASARAGTIFLTAAPANWAVVYSATYKLQPMIFFG